MGVSSWAMYPCRVQGFVGYWGSGFCVLKLLFCMSCPRCAVRYLVSCLGFRAHGFVVYLFNVQGFALCFNREQDFISWFRGQALFFWGIGR